MKARITKTKLGDWQLLMPPTWKAPEPAYTDFSGHTYWPTYTDTITALNTALRDGE